MKDRKQAGFTKRVSNEEFSKMAKMAIEQKVRPQVERHERIQKGRKASAEVTLTAAQKAHLVCRSPL